jgi:hypothetical protein
LISPPVAVVMAGIVFGFVQIFLPVLQVRLSDESWFFWILAWIVGFINWVFIYEKISGGLKKRAAEFKRAKSEEQNAAFVEE